MSRVIASVASFVNPELVVIGGAVAESAGVLLPGITALLPRFTGLVYQRFGRNLATTRLILALRANAAPRGLNQTI